MVPAGASVAMVGVSHDDSTYTWGNAVVTVEYAMDQGLGTWHSYDITLTSTNKARQVPVVAAHAIRLRVSTSENGTDPNAQYSVSFGRNVTTF